MGIITSSTSYQYVREVFGEKACVLKLGLSWPMPVQKIRDFAAQVGQVLVVEELEPIIENHCRQIGVAVTGKEKIPLVDESYPRRGGQKPGAGGETDPDLGRSHSRSPAGYVRGMSSPGGFLHAVEK